MKKVINVLLLVVTMLLILGVEVNANNTVQEKEINKEKVKVNNTAEKKKAENKNKANITTDDNDIKVLKLDYGVEVQLEPDQPIHIDIEWWHNLFFNIDKDLNTNVISSTISYSWGTTQLNYNLTFSKQFLPDNKIDNGRISFSFSRDF